MPPESPKDTYIFRLSSLGDLVLCTPLLKALARDPKRQLTFVTEKKFEAFVKSSSPVSLRVLPIDTAARGLLKFFRAGWNEGRRVRAQRRGAIEVFDLHGVLKSRLWIWGFVLGAYHRTLRIEVRQTPKKGWRRLLSAWLHRDFLGSRHVYREHLALIDPASLEKPELKISVSPSPALESGARQTARSPRVLIAPDAQHWKKRWPAHHWESLLKKILRETNWEFTLVGGLRALPIDLIDDLAAQAPGRLHNLLGQSQLEDLATIAAKHVATVCGNSAWLHISEAVGTPVVTLAGPIVPGFGFSPWLATSRELSVDNLPCRPCTRHGDGACVLKDDRFHACMKDISSDEVFTALKSCIEAKL